ncbi:MAG: bifunctional diguanylate cyclase/phosphohydrolase [Gaiellaceae bacterium]
MTRPGRSLKLAVSVVVAAISLGAAIGVVEAVLAWSAQAEATELRELVALLAVALAALAGIVAMAHRAIELVTRPKPVDRRRSDRELARLVSEARTDSLTKLANHRAFHDDLAAEIGRRNSTGSLFSLMAIDLDGLKSINDTGGHQAGDAYIVRLAQGIESVVGSSGSVYRTGGDEFMVILPGSRNWHSINIAHRILGASRTRSGARALSIGVTETKGTEHRQALVRQADLALYEAKRSTIGVVPFQPGMEPAATAPPSDELSSDQRALAAALARTLAARDPGTRDHSETVAELATGMAAQQGIQGQHLERLRIAALLHDVGKIGVPDSILHKRTPPAASEREEMRRHIVVGRDILVAAGFAEAATWVYHHHEHVDGTGYPEGLRGSEIPLESRIIAVADAFEAMTGTRPYRETVPTEQALAELFESAGAQLDVACVRTLAELVSGNLPASLLSPTRTDDSGLKSGIGMP